MKAKNVISFILIMVLIAAFASVCAFDIKIGNFEVPSVLGEKGIKQGLDLVGGSIIVFEPDVPEGTKVTAEQMDSAERVIRARLDAQNYTEATISRQGETGLRVEIPNIDDPQAAVEMIGKVAKLQFLDADGNEIMDGSETYVKKAESAYGQVNQGSSSEHHVILQFTSEGREKFKEATAAAVAAADEGKNYIAIALDGEVQLAPSVKDVIDDDSCVITGNYTAEEAKETADLIN
ncbi:MAG: preprotein translocase subunit SecD, partial [Clostridia bacterium]